MNRTAGLLIISAVGILALVLMGQVLRQRVVPDIDPGGSAKLERASHLNQEGLAKLTEGRPAEAVVVFRAARDLQPGNAAISHNLSLGLARVAMSRSDKGDVRSARDLLGEALDVWPENPEALRVMAAIQYRAGQYREARKTALRLNGLYPGDMDVEQFIVHLEANIREAEGMVSEEGHHFRLLYSGDRRLEFEGEFLLLLQDEMDSLTSLMGYFPSDVIEVLLMTEDLGERSTPEDPLLSALYDGKIRVYLVGHVGSEEDLRKIVRHEMVHALLHRAGGILPGWFQEGLAQFLGDRLAEEGPAMRSYLLMRLRDGYVLDLSGIGESFIQLAEDERTTAYAASYLFLEYLIRTYGENLIPIILGELERGVALEAVLRELTGKDVAALQTDFLADIRRGG